MCHILWVSPTFSVKLTKLPATTEQVETDSGCARGGSGLTLGRISSLKRWSSCPGGCGVTIPEGVWGMTGCGTQCSGLIGEVEISQMLDSGMLEVFSNLNDFIFYDSTHLTSTHGHSCLLTKPIQCYSCWIFSQGTHRVSTTVQKS